MNLSKYDEGPGPGQPADPSRGQYTAVNIPPDPPRDHIVWSIFNFIYVNFFCLGLVAFLFSVKARDRKVAGDLEGARRYSSIALILNIVATILVSLSVLIAIITISVIFASMSHAYSRPYYG